jgi:hypothetical protein
MTMSQNLETLKSVVANIEKNRAGIAAQIVASMKAYGDPTPEVAAAIDLLIKTYDANVQLIGHAIGAKLQIEQLEKTALEVNALIASLEVVVNDPDADAKITQQLSAQVLRAAANS